MHVGLASSKAKMSNLQLVAKFVNSPPPRPFGVVETARKKWNVTFNDAKMITNHSFSHFSIHFYDWD